MGGILTFFRLGSSSAHPREENSYFESSSTPFAMKAVYYRKHGEAKQTLLYTEHFTKPLPAKGQVVVEVKAASVNPRDVKLRRYDIPQFINPLPKIIGTDFSGVVSSVSACTNPKFAVGAKVFGQMPILYSHWGSTASFVCIDEDLICTFPDKISFNEAASLPLVALTIMQGLENFEKSHSTTDGNTQRKTVLVQAGAGGLGTFAIQYCSKVLNLEVYTTCSPQNDQFVRDLGADVVIDYKVDSLDNYKDRFDVVIDNMAYIYESQTFKAGIIKSGGRYVKIASSSNSYDAANKDPLGMSIPETRIDRVISSMTISSYHNVLSFLGYKTIGYDYVIVQHNQRRLQRLAELLEEGRIKAVVDRVYGMRDAGQAHEHVEGGHARGKVIIAVE